MRKINIVTLIAALSLWLVGCDQAGDQGAASSDQQSSAARESSSGDNAAASTSSRDVDNSGINKRDANEEALTPGDQGASEQDREITRKIRRAITQNDQLSTTAKNIKIITTNGKVTLRGPVNSQAEREQIAAVAQQLAGAGSLDNQLEVKQTTATDQERK